MHTKNKNVLFQNFQYACLKDTLIETRMMSHGD